MWSSLIVLHTDSENREVREFDKFFSWHTCMRSIYVGDSRLVSFRKLPDLYNYSIFTGYEAYRFLLEVASGTHSRLFGESEIQSQFRDSFCPDKVSQIPILSQYLLKLRDHILEHSRIVRSKFFTCHGRQTYGGLADSLLPSNDSIALLGTGNLAESMVTHLMKKNRPVVVVGRNSTKLRELRERFGVETTFWEDYTPGKDHIVVAAPVEIDSWMSRVDPGKKILDFRGEATILKPLPHISYTPFQQILDQIKDTEDRLNSIRPLVSEKITALTVEREGEQYHMPHGWEDLACYTI